MFLISLVGLFMLGGGAIAWKMRAVGGAAGGVDPERERMRVELQRLTVAESAYVKANGRYAATMSELASPVTSRVVVFASARDGYHIRMSRPGTVVLCEVSAGRFAVAHTGWQLICGTPVAPGEPLVDTSSVAGWSDRAVARVRTMFHEDCDAECRAAKLREGFKSPERRELEHAVQQL